MKKKPKEVRTCRRCFKPKNKQWYEIMDTKTGNKITLCVDCGASFYKWFNQEAVDEK